ncbi:hypothetical protein V8E53_002538 [Lactarius tabidus]
MVLLAVIPRIPHTEELLNVLYANTGIAGLCLLVTAIQQTVKSELSLFHAIFIQHILFFLGIGVAPVGKYNWTRSRIAMGVVVQFLLIIAFTIWSVYVWARVEHLGPQFYLNVEMKYVLMFANVNATKHWLRYLWIIVLVACALVLMTIFGINGFALFVMRHDEEVEETRESEREWYFYISYSQIIAAIYSTVMLELTVQRNSTQHKGKVEVDNSWAFGQTLAVVMIFANLNEVIHFLIDYIARRRKRSHERQEEGQQESNHTDIPLASAPYRPTGLPESHILARDSPRMILSSEYELLNLNRESSHVQVTAATGVEMSP